MKKLFVILYIFAGINLFSQDTLFLKNGDKKVIKLVEVAPNEIKYKRGDNTEGPTYILDRREIIKVKYATGEEEQLGAAATKTTEPQPTVKSNPSISGNRQLTIRDKDVFFVGEKIPDAELKKFIDEYQFPNNKALMLEHFSKVMDYKSDKNIYTAFVPIGFAIPAVATVGGLAILWGNNLNPDVGGYVFLGGVVVGAALRISGFALSKMYKNKYRAERVKIAILYNESK